MRRRQKQQDIRDFLKKHYQAICEIAKMRYTALIFLFVFFMPTLVLAGPFEDGLVAYGYGRNIYD